jgi:outer membrane receptor protein involved in Fe transport
MEFDVNGNRYGLQFEYSKPVFQSKNQFYKLSLGAVDEFFVKDERDIEGITGNTVSNVLGVTVSNSLYFLKTKKLFFTNTLYAGWGHRRTKANYTNEQFNIHRDYRSSFNYFAFGAYWKLAYRIKDRISMQAIGKTDLSRLIDKYEPTIFERPGFMYGIGIIYSIK